MDVWFRQDVTRILVAIGAAGEGHPPAYHRALADIGLAFGIVLPRPDPDDRAHLAGILDAIPSLHGDTTRRL